MACLRWNLGRRTGPAWPRSWPGCPSSQLPGQGSRGPGPVWVPNLQRPHQLYGMGAVGAEEEEWAKQALLPYSEPPSGV